MTWTDLYVAQRVFERRYLRGTGPTHIRVRLNMFIEKRVTISKRKRSYEEDYYFNFSLFSDVV